MGNTLQAGLDEETGILTFSWSAVSGAVQYNTHRGSIPAGGMGSRIPDTFDHVCFESADAAGDGAAVTIDPGLPPAGTAYDYLVSGENACAEGLPGRIVRRHSPAEPAPLPHTPLGAPRPGNRW